MNGNTSIKAMQIRQGIVNIRVVHVLQGPGLAIINAYGLVVTFGLGLEVVRGIRPGSMSRVSRQIKARQQPRR